MQESEQQSNEDTSLSSGTEIECQPPGSASEREGMETEPDALEELILESAAEDNSLDLGTAHIMGDEHYIIEGFLPRGYYRARREQDGQAVILRPRPMVHDGLWDKMELAPKHPRLPEILYIGEDGIVLEAIEGEKIQTGIPLHAAVDHLHGVVQLMRFLAVKKVVATDIDLAGLMLTPDMEVKLQYLPSIVPMGESAQVVFGDGATPLEDSVTENATEATSMFLWGAMLYALVSGRFLPAEGLDMITLNQLQEPGLPQLLSASMLDTDICPDLRTLMGLYRDFRHPPYPQYQIGASSTVGLNPTRTCNEDSYGIVQHHWAYHDRQWHCIRACVADGMGGEEAGEIASQAAVDTFCHHPSPPQLERADIQADWTRELGWTANDAVVDAVDGTGGGCTLTGIVIVQDRLTLAHVGDSRAYLYSLPSGLELLSRDHSQVRSLMDSGIITEEEAATSTDTNQVLRALGTARHEALHADYVDTLASLADAEGQSIRPAYMTLKAGDLVLLMSDGIWGSWEYRESIITGELTKVIEKADFRPQQIADALLQCALEAGGDDNATIVVVARVG